MTPEILSVHDASPKFQRELEKIFGGLERAPGKNKWIAVVPFWNREWDIRRYPEFLRLIRAQQSKGWEIILHGYSHSHPQRPPWFHRFFATREGWEFHGLNYAETAALAQPALTIFEEAFGFRPRGFIAPNWSITAEGRRALGDLGIEFTVSFRDVHWRNGARKTAWIDEMHFKSAPLYWAARGFLSLVANGNHIVFHPQRRGVSILESGVSKP